MKNQTPGMIRSFIQLFFFLSLPALAQPGMMDSYFAQVRERKSPAFPNELFKIENIKPNMNRLPVYLNDSLAIVREKALLLAKLIGKRSMWAPTRAQVVRWLVAGTRDKSSGNVGAALQHLTEFPKRDFRKPAVDSLKALVSKKQPYLELVVKLLGFLEVKEIETELYNLSQDNSIGRKERWACTLALVRLGNTSAVQAIHDMVKPMAVNDAVVYQIFPDLIYTRSKILFDYLVEALHSDSKNCLAGDPDQEENIPCAYRIIELLAPVVVDCPIKHDASGEMITTNYKEALPIIRVWFNKNPDYRLVREIF